MRALDRRGFVKEVVALSAAVGAVGIPGLGMAPAEGRALAGTVWHKAPCRLCGVGCGLLVGLTNGRASAVKGDLDSPVAGGLACVRGYLSVQALRGEDRITRALVRRDGALVPVPLGEALDLVARKIRESIDQHGKDSVGLYGSAQWTILDAYVASKLVKGGLGTNNLETSTRLYGAGAMAGLDSTFGLDGAVGCYDDIDHADTIVLWDTNLAETDPVLFSRILARRRDNPAVRIIDLATRTTRTSYAADRAALFLPHGALEIAQAVCHELVASEWVDWDFVNRYVAFKKTASEAAPEPPDGGLVAERPADASRDEFLAGLETYSAERAQRLTGMPAETIRWVASLYGDPARKVMSIWGANVHQDVRGTWTNNALYNIHLLAGKMGTPGNAAFATTGQPNGGAAPHDAGTLTHTLPRGLVTRPEDRERAARIWGVPADRIDPRPGGTAVGLFDALDRGDLRVLWIQATNPMLSLPDLDRYRRAARQPDRFIVVSEAYPTPTTDLADVVLPAAIWIEREGIYANPERRVQHFAKLTNPPGDATSDAELMIQVGRRLGLASLFPWDRDHLADQIWEEYQRFHADGPSPLPPLAELRRRPGVYWPYRDGHETKWRYHTAHDPAADRARGDFDFYGHPDHRAWVWLRPDRPAAEAPDRAYPLWLVTGGVLEHWGGGAMTQRIATLHRALPHAYVEINPADAATHKIQRGDLVRLVSRRGALELEARIDYRSQPPRGQVFVPTFDEGKPINRLTGRAHDPWSGQPDDRKCAVRLERAGAGANR